MFIFMFCALSALLRVDMCLVAIIIIIIIIIRPKKKQVCFL